MRLAARGEVFRGNACKRGGPEFWLTLVALLGLAGMQAVYWIFTHPVNRFWLKGESLGRAGAGFFSFASSSKHGSN